MISSLIPATIALRTCGKIVQGDDPGLRDAFSLVCLGPGITKILSQQDPSSALNEIIPSGIRDQAVENISQSSKKQLADGEASISTDRKVAQELPGIFDFVPSWQDSIPLVVALGTAEKILQGDDPGLVDALPLVYTDNIFGHVSPNAGMIVDAPPNVLSQQDENSSLIESTHAGSRDQIIEKLSPSLNQQLADGENLVSLNTKVVSERSEILDGEERHIIHVQQEVVDSRYLDYGNLLDVVKQIRAGEIPEIDELFLALVDTLDAFTLQMARPLLTGWKVRSHKGLRDIDVTIVDIHTSHENVTPESIESNIHKWEVKRPGPDVDLEVNNKITTQQESKTDIHARQTTVSLHETQFGDNISLLTPGKIISTETEATIHEKTIENNRISKNLMTKAEVENVGTYHLNGPSEIRNIESVKENIYSTDHDIHNVLEDGKLTSEELESNNFNLIDVREDIPKVADSQESGNTSFIASGITPAVPESPSVLLSNDTFKPLMQLADNVQNQQNMTLEDGFNVVNLILSSQLTQPSLEATGASKKDTMIGSYTDTSTEEKQIVGDVKNIEKPFYQPDERVENIESTKSKHTLQTDIEATQVNYSETYNSSGPLAEETPSNVLARNESRSIILVNEVDRTETTKSNSKRTTKTLFGKDVGGIIGIAEEKGATVQQTTNTPRQRVYEVKGADVSVAIADGQLTQTELDSLNARKIHTERGETERDSQVLDQGGKVEFKEGWLDYLPLGSVVSTGVKSSYGMELSGSDYFWATVDGVGTIATLGVGAAASAAFRTASKGVAKGIVQGSAKKVGQALVKGGKKGTEVLGNEITQRGKEFSQIAMKGEKIVVHATKGEFNKAGRIISRETGQATQRLVHNVQEQVNGFIEPVEALWKKSSNVGKLGKRVGSRSGRVVVKNKAKDATKATLTNLPPNAKKTVNGYTYQTDSYGRPKSVSGHLQLQKGDRNIKSQTEVAKMGKPGDDGGHLIGAQFNGPKEAINIVPQNSNLNRGDWKSMEMQWRREIQNGNSVNVDIRPQYIGDSARPSSFVVRYEVDGKVYRKTFTNEIPRDTLTNLAAVKGVQEGLQVVQDLENGG